MSELRVRDGNKNVYVKVNDQDVDCLWICLSIGKDPEGLSEKEKFDIVQDAWEEQFNKPDYNNWHQFDRHHGNVWNQFYEDDGTGNEAGGGIWAEPSMAEVRDASIFDGFEKSSINKMDEQILCERIHKALKKKDAEIIIAKVFRGMSNEEYALMTGESANTISHRYRRALEKCQKKLPELFPDRSFNERQ